MRIVLITTRLELDENARIANEVDALGYEFKLYNLNEFEYSIKNGKLAIGDFFVYKSDLLIPRAVFNCLHPISSFIQNLRERGIKVFDNNLLLHKYSINKPSDLIKLTSASIPIPDSYHLHSFQKFDVVASKIGYPLLLKLTRTGKGAGIHKIDDKGELTAFINQLQEKGSKAKDYLIQKFIPYKFDLRVLIVGDVIFSMRRTPAEGEFRANFSLGGRVEQFNLDEAGRSLARKALKASNLLVGGVDMLITEDNKRYILEVNHTPGMLGMEKATGENITKIYLEYAIENAY